MKNAGYFFQIEKNVFFIKLIAMQKRGQRLFISLSSSLYFENISTRLVDMTSKSA